MALYMTHTATLRSASSAQDSARRIAPWVAQYTASQARQCADHIVRDLRSKYQPATINRSLATLKKSLALAWVQGLTRSNLGEHIQSLPVNNKREVFLSVEQVRHLASHCSPPTQTAIWIALYTGARRAEVLAMRPQDIDTTTGTITIHASNTKTLKTRVIPIVPALRPWLQHLPVPLNAEGLGSNFERGRNAAGMPHVHYHDLRHSCASILMASGADLYTVSKILGHSTITTTQRYAHLEVRLQAVALERAFK